MGAGAKKLGLLLLTLAALAAGALALLRPELSAPAGRRLTLEDIPIFSGEPYVELEGNVPRLSLEEGLPTGYEVYSELDGLGRCGAAVALVGPETMPEEPRGAIGQIKPTGWRLVRYDFIDGKYLYNRCHLIAYQLAGENDNEKNLITGTRYMNVTGMLPFENRVGGYVRSTGGHVLYRVTPVFRGDNLLADGVEMEALSLEDNGEGVCFHVFVYNAQPGVSIDYATGESRLAREDAPSLPAAAQPSVVASVQDVPAQPEESVPAGEAAGEGEEVAYVLNLRSRKFHYPDCKGVAAMSEKNKALFTGSREELLERGFEPCGQCKP